MNRKVLRMMDLVEQGFAVHHCEPHADGGLRMALRHDEEAAEFSFDFYEVPAIHAATKVVGIGG